LIAQQAVLCPAVFYTMDFCINHFEGEETYMKNGKQLISLCVLIVLAGIVVLGCKKKEEGMTVGLALTGIQTNSIFIDMKKAIEAKCNEAGYKLIATDLAEGPIKMVSFLENCINAKAKVIIYQNIAEDAYMDLLQRAKEEGAILGSYDNPSTIAQYTSLASNYELGLTIGRDCGKWVESNPGSKKVGLCSFSYLEFLVLREQGMRDGFAETCPSGQIVMSLNAGPDPQSCVAAGENFLQAHPDIQAAMGVVDTQVLGVWEAFKAAGKSFEKNHIGLFGCDASDDGLAAIRANDMFLCTIDLDVVNQVVELFDRCVKLALTGEYEQDKAVAVFPMKAIYLSNIDDVGKPVR
jgi:fructose transport system substrate-binding protein